MEIFLIIYRLDSFISLINENWLVLWFESWLNVHLLNKWISQSNSFERRRRKKKQKLFETCLASLLCLKENDINLNLLNGADIQKLQRTKYVWSHEKPVWTIYLRAMKTKLMQCKYLISHPQHSIHQSNEIYSCWFKIKQWPKLLWIQYSTFASVCRL